MTSFPMNSASAIRLSARRSLVVGAVALALVASACGSSSGSAGSTTSTTRETQPSTTTRASAPTAAQSALVAARPYTVQTPSGYDPAKPAPLVILLHGYGATGAIQDAYLKLGPAADRNGMLSVHLDGTKNGQDKQFWNATDACCDFETPKVDDRAYIRAVIADVAATHTVDPKRVYLVGHSNGAFMSFAMACDHADTIAAIVSLEGATWLDPSRCRPSESVAVLVVHGTGDKTIKYDGGSTGIAEYPGAVTTAKTWAKYDGCATKPSTPAPESRAIVKEIAPATVTVYSDGCRGNGHVELWTQPEGVHIPLWTDDFADQMVEFLLAHPKR